MEPGHEDREYHLVKSELIANEFLPQWSPVMKTGNTGAPLHPQRTPRGASMEPGHEDREYQLCLEPPVHGDRGASMEPGHEDREYPGSRLRPERVSGGLNGARS